MHLDLFLCESFQLPFKERVSMSCDRPTVSRDHQLAQTAATNESNMTYVLGTAVWLAMIAFHHSKFDGTVSTLTCSGGYISAATAYNAK
jgi:hypothetical protein